MAETVQIPEDTLSVEITVSVPEAPVPSERADASQALLEAFAADDTTSALREQQERQESAEVETFMADTRRTMQQHQQVLEALPLQEQLTANPATEGPARRQAAEEAARASGPSLRANPRTEIPARLRAIGAADLAEAWERQQQTLQPFLPAEMAPLGPVAPETEGPPVPLSAETLAAAVPAPLPVAAIADHLAAGDLPRLPEEPEAPRGDVGAELEAAVTRGGAGIARGALGSLESMLAAPEALGVVAAGGMPAEALETARQWLAAQRATFNVDDPGAWDKLTEGLGSMLAFWVPGLGSSAAIATAGRFIPVLARFAGLTGAGVSALTEAAAESGGVYTQMRDLVGEDEAARRANTVFWKNALLVFISNRVGLFAEQGRGLSRFLAGAIGEGVQEAIQYDTSQHQFSVPGDHPAAERLLAQGWIQDGDQVKAPVTMAGRAEAALLGAVLGGPAAVVTGAVLGQEEAGLRDILGSQGLAVERQLPDTAVREGYGTETPGKLKRVYHGTPEAFPDFEAGRSEPTALYGPGVYFTENPAIASSYAAKGPSAPSAANVRPAFLDIQHPFDVEATPDTALLHALEQDLEDYPVREDGHTPDIQTNQEVYDAVAQDLGSKDLANTWLQEQGYDGITHMGGQITGGQAHRVWIAFDPEQVKPAFSLLDALIGGEGFAATAEEAGAGGGASGARTAGAESDFTETVRAQMEDLLTRPDLPITGFQANINYERINSPAEVKQLLARVREVARESIERLRRGTITREEIVRKARENIASGEFTLEKLLFREPGTALNAEDIMAARFLTTSLATEFSTRLASLDPNDQTTWEPHFKAFHLFQQVLGQYMGAEAEAGRAMNAFIPDATGELQFLRQVGATIEQLPTGVSVAEWKAHLSQITKPEELARITEKAPTYWDMLLEMVYGMRLSAFRTHERNMLGNTFTFFWTGLEHELAAFGGNVAHGEGLAMAYGMHRASMDLLRMWRLADDHRMAAVKVRAEQLAPGALEGSKVELRQRQPALTAQNLAQAGTVGRVLTHIPGVSTAANWMGTLARKPGQALEWEDLFAKVVNYQGSLYAQGYREGVLQRQLKGDDLWQFIGEYATEAPETAHEVAKTQALENTFQEKLTGFAAMGEDMVNFHPALRLAIMFYRTPTNISRWALRRTPAAVFGERYQTMQEQGGAQADLATARVWAGSTLLVTGTLLALQGLITGRPPAEPERRRTMEEAGTQWYSLYNPVTKTYQRYDPFDPLSMLLGMGADLAEIYKDPLAWKDATWAEKARTGLAMPLVALRNNILSRSWATGARDLLTLVNPPPHLEADEVAQMWNRYLTRQATSMVVPRAVADLAKQLDPVQREAVDFLDNLVAEIPWMSQSLPMARNIFAHARRDYDSLGPDYISPILQTDATRGSVVEREMARLTYTRGARFAGIPTVVEVEGLRMRLTAEERERFARLMAGAPMTGEVPQKFEGKLEAKLAERIQLHQEKFPSPNRASDEALITDLKIGLQAARESARFTLLRESRFQAVQTQRRGERAQELERAQAPRPGAAPVRVGQ